MNASLFLESLGRSSCAATVLALLVLAAQRLFRRQLPPSWSCALWLLVFIRLIPFSAPSPASLQNLLPAFSGTASAASLPARASMGGADALEEGLTALQTPGDAADNRNRMPEVQSWLERHRPSPPTLPAVQRIPAAGRSGPESPTGAAIPWTDVLFIAWAAGAAALALKIAFGARAAHRRFAHARRLDEPRLNRLLHEARLRMGVRRVPSVAECHAIDSPAVQGFLRPRLLFPAGRVAAYSDEELRHILLHELAHLKRRDLALNWIAAALQTLHWFNPLVWYAFHRWRLDREIACDALALTAAGPDQNRAYGRTMLRLVEQVVERRAAPQCVGILEDKNQLRSRLRMILSYTPARRWTLPAALLLATLAAVGLTDAQTTSTDKVPGKGGPRPENEPRPVAATSAPSAGVQKTSRKLTLRVVDDATGLPLSGAVATVPNLRDLTSEDLFRFPRFDTDASGIVTLGIPPAQFMPDQETQFSVLIEHPGHCTRTLVWMSRSGHVREDLPETQTVRLTQGVAIGGRVVDHSGRPIRGAKLHLFSVPTTRQTGDAPAKRFDENDTLSAMGDKALVTDADGRWGLQNAPAHLGNLTIMATRPEGYTKRFMLKAPDSFASRESAPLDRDALLAQNAVLAFEAGHAVQGRVTDAQGNPVPGAKMSATLSSTNNSSHTFTSDKDGRFALGHWENGTVLITAQSPGYAIGMSMLTIKGDISDAKLILQPASPLKIRAVDAEDRAVPGATISLSPVAQYRTGLSWSQKTDSTGRAEWPEAPASQLEFILRSSTGAFRTAKLTADGNEQVLRLGAPAERAIQINLQVVDDDSGVPLQRFEVWRQTGGKERSFWGTGSAAGQFEGSCSITDFRSDFTQDYRIQVRAPGYSEWSSDLLNFTEGGKTLRVRMKRGPAGSTAGASRRSVPFLAAEDQQADLSALSAVLKLLLETGDASAFVAAVGVSWKDWLSVLPKDLAPHEMPFGPNPEAYFDRASKRLRASAEHLLSQARAMGLAPGSMRFAYREAAVHRITQAGYRFGSKHVLLPKIDSVRLVFDGTPLREDGKSGALAGTYVFVLGDITQFGNVWRLNRGVRLASVPKPLSDERFTSSVLLLDAIEDTNLVTGVRPLSGADDRALDELAARCRALLQTRDVDAFVRDLRYSLEGTRARWAKNDLGDVSNVESAWNKNTDLLRKSATAVVEQLSSKNIDLAKADLKLRHVTATRPATERYGDPEGIACPSVRIVFDVTSTRAEASGKAIDGAYALQFGSMLRLSDRWWNVDGSLRWQNLPEALLSAQEKQALAIENHIADKRVLPEGTPAPRFTVQPLEGDGAPLGLAALRGKIVFLEFWASWCGPCQEPMEKLQKAIAAHPEWKDRVEFLAVSIDEKRETGAAHVRKKDWNRSRNAWAGPGGFQSAAATLFRVSGVPTCYLIDAKGTITRGGHPASFDLEACLAEMLRPESASQRTPSSK